ncbi:MAG: MBL fold metallo-hydrolase [Candidatus Wallbacteria bacterium]|nr:MBL fold metallo-hydrolase [Candidatus Wallbacteria bacterium]
MILETFPVGAFQCNCSILGDEETREAIVIDPGEDVSTILERVRELGLTVKALVHTHAHLDHVSGSRALKLATGAEIMLHKDDEWLYQNLAMQAAMFGWQVDEPLAVDRYLKQGDTVAVGKVGGEILFTPGHTPGSLCFKVDGTDPVLFSGDTLFQQSIGRTDLWGGSFPDIIQSIKKKLLVLPGDTLVIPGHGETTTIDEEKRMNPFLR